MTGKTTLKTIRGLKERGEKIAVLTAYDYSTAKYLDEAGADIILVGDSLANVALGYSSTNCVSMEEMLIFTGAVSRGVSRAFVIGDMPFMSCNLSVETALENAGRMIKSGANAVKIENCNDYLLEVIERLVSSGIPVLGHLGYTPQSENTLSGHYVQGKSMAAAEEILEKAKMLESAGVFAIVLEMIPQECAKYITENLTVPTIGIGSGHYCSGQVMVSDDMLGKFTDYKPKFVRHYADLKGIITDAAREYCSDVKSGNYPNDEEVFHLNNEETEKLKSRELLC